MQQCVRHYFAALWKLWVPVHHHLNYIFPENVVIYEARAGIVKYAGQRG